MPLGNKSLVQLATCQPELRRFVEAVMEGIEKGECSGVFDLTVICGFRGEHDQNVAFAEGKSKLQWPKSKHNHLPSLAVDMAPYPIDWDDLQAFRNLREYALKVAKRIGVKIRVISWDWPHYELMG